MEIWSAKPQLRVLLDHLATIKDTRQSWKVAYPLREVPFLVVCGTSACGDDHEDIVDWSEAHLSFLRGFSDFYHGIPCADWLRVVMNRMDPFNGYRRSSPMSQQHCHFDASRSLTAVEQDKHDHRCDRDEPIEVARRSACPWRRTPSP